MSNDISPFLGKKHPDINNWLIMNSLLSHHRKFDIFMLYESKHITKSALSACVFIMSLPKILTNNLESSETDFADSRATREHDRVNEYVRKAVLTVPQTAIFHFYHLRTRDSLKKGWVALMCTSDCSILRVLPPPSIIRS